MERIRQLGANTTKQQDKRLLDKAQANDEIIIEEFLIN
jgi:hypothetical protein